MTDEYTMVRTDKPAGPQTVSLFGIEIHALTMDEALIMCEQCIREKRSLLLGVVNVAKLVNCRKNIELRKSLVEADIVMADGLPIVWLSRLLGTPLPERVAGIDIMHELLALASRENYSVFFLGAKQQVIQTAVENFQMKYPGIRIAGYRDGYFRESEEKDVAEQIRNSSADILFVGVPTPQKENFLRKWRRYLNVSICHGVGGSFDIVAGVTKRAPIWMQKCGMEWFYRLVQEPRKMWKRYLVTNVVFIVLGVGAVIRTRLGGLCGMSGVDAACDVKTDDE